MTAHSRRFAAIYAGWICFCALLFILLRGAEDPSRRPGRIQSLDAGRHALASLRKLNRTRYRDYEVVHVASARAGEGGPEGRWVVLLDRVPHSGLREAVVVEVEAASGRVLVVRRPVK